MNNFWERNKIILAIIIGAFIVGGFVYFGLKNNNSQSKSSSIYFPPKIQTPVPPKNLSPQIQTKTNSVASSDGSAKCGATENTIVTKVIDGDTVVVEGGYHIRLLGMDADEKGYPCYDAAKTRIENLVLGKQVTLEKDVSDIDQYGRCLRYIFLGNTNIDVQLVREGLAVARFYEPDIKYKAEITLAEKQAQTSKTGCKWVGNTQIVK